MHEAGHAVVMCHYGLEIESVVINRVFWNCAQIAEAPVHQVLNVYAAGRIAAEQFCGVANTGSGDLDDAAELVCRVFPNCQDHHQLIIDADAVTLPLVLRFRRQIVSVAAELLRRRELTQVQVDSAIAAGMPLTFIAAL